MSSTLLKLNTTFTILLVMNRPYDIQRFQRLFYIDLQYLNLRKHMMELFQFFPPIFQPMKITKEESPRKDLFKLLGVNQTHSRSLYFNMPQQFVLHPCVLST